MPTTESGRGQLFDREQLITDVDYELPVKDSGSVTEAMLRPVDVASLDLLVGAIAANTPLTLRLDGGRRWDCLLQRVDPDPDTPRARAVGRGTRTIY
jgi:hypothetical protein